MFNEPASAAYDEILVLNLIEVLVGILSDDPKLLQGFFDIVGRRLDESSDVVEKSRSPPRQVDSS